MLTDPTPPSSSTSAVPATRNSALASSSLLSLPNYSTEFPNVSLPEPPTYTPGAGQRARPRERSEHVYHLLNGADKPWLTLRVLSWAPSEKHLPVFIEGETVNGLVEMNLEKAENVKQVVVYFKGHVISSMIDTKIFTRFTKVVFNANDTPGSRKLKGKFTWLFSLPIERLINPAPEIAKQLNISGDEPLPPNVGGKGAQSEIEYFLGVSVKRGGFFSEESILDALLTYVPVTIPGEPSALRRQAYAEGESILGPELDPEGWKVFPDVDIRGVIFKSRTISVACSLALAAPLSYTRSSAIPCFLTLRSSDVQALDLLSSPSAPVLQIRRKVKTHIGVENTMRGSFEHSRENNLVSLSKAVWAPAQTIIHENGSQIRTMYGELGLPGNLTPSFTFGEFEVKYMVDLLPFSVSGFVPDQTSRLSRSEVQIVTGFLPGPAPRAYLPPCYNIHRDGGARRSR